MGLEGMQYNSHANKACDRNPIYTTASAMIGGQSQHFFPRVSTKEMSPTQEEPLDLRTRIRRRNASAHPTNNAGSPAKFYRPWEVSPEAEKKMKRKDGPLEEPRNFQVEKSHIPESQVNLQFVYQVAQDQQVQTRCDGCGLVFATINDLHLHLVKVSFSIFDVVNNIF